MGVLKIIGMVLLILLGIVIAFVLISVLCVLFVPFRYRFWGWIDTTKKDHPFPPLDLGLTISWLLKIFCIKVDWEDNRIVVIARFMWIYLYDSTRELTDPRNRVARFVAEKLGLYEEPEKKTGKTPAAPVAKEEPKKEPQKEEDKKTSVPEQETPPKPSETVATRKNIKVEETPEKSVWEKLEDKVNDIKYSIEKKLELFRNIWAKVKIFLDICGQEFTRKVLANIFRYVCKIIAYCLPTKWSGSAAYGIKDNPRLAGKIMAWLGMMYPLYGRNFKITPESFDAQCGKEPYLTMDIAFSGRIRTIRILYYFLRIVIERNTFRLVKYLFKLWRNKDGERE